MKFWPRTLLLYFSLALLLAGLIFYGVLVSRTIIPPGSTPGQIARQIQKYGLDRPVPQLYAPFLFTFLPGLALLGLYVTVGLRQKDFHHWIVTRVVIIFLLITSVINIWTFFVTAQASLQDALPAFWLSLAVALLALGNFIFLLLVWNGRRWGMWAYGISTFVMDTLKFVGHIPIFPILFELFSVVILIVLLRPVWNEEMV